MPETYYSKAEIAQILANIRVDLHVPYHKEDGVEVPVSHLQAMEITIDRVLDNFGIHTSNPPRPRVDTALIYTDC